ncbi:PaaI family thioesterase [Burkholderia gladioli]|uniref:Thioesterase family protein n=1 Tax=Burkholderia gladioli (strain BSR3) TaxID=999541 RepID=F2LT45_BURGS|nr:PaaI family thioesterase [Burkholderia gladioli]AEA65921.1 thioesterase family protein [Burkholderia gladioli BSR3]MBW5286839.1 PaaI family thioesterase [Burkholderia gladioli]
MSEQRDADYFNRLGKANLPGLLGMVVTELDGLYVKAQLDVRQSLLAPNGYLHAGTLVSMADTACGYGCFANLPEGATNFTTIELKSNFLSTTRDGVIHCEAHALHPGRTIQVWDAQVIHEGKLLATFRCTQMILWPTR